MSPFFNICVVGDSMVDEYYSVCVNGVSPEFPIPVMHSTDSLPDTRPGGAANVTHQLSKFRNVNLWLVSFLDEYFRRTFSGTLFDTSLSLDIPSSIPIKRRFYSDGFPTYRWDIESINYGLGSESPAFCKNLYENLLSKVSCFDAVIFSDYCKGVFDSFTHVPRNVLTVVDSKSKDIDKWFGCTVFKPNLSEASKLSGKDNPIDAGRWIRSRIKCEHVVITNAEKGVTIVSKDGECLIDPVSSKDAMSVIGAGDCFTSMLTLSLVEGLNIKRAAERALRASSIYVQRKYNSPISPLDLLDGKFVSDPTLLADRDFKLVFTNGCFDLLHNGHIENLKFARSKGDRLVVALNDDESVSRLKPGRPMQPLQDRMNVLSSLEFVDYVVSFSEDTPLESMVKINPDVLVKGDEYGFHQVVGSDIIKEVFTFPMIDGFSTTKLIEKIKKIGSFYDKSC